MLRRPKDPTLIWPEAADQYKIYFDVRIDAAKVQRLLTYMVDGRFLDDATQTVEVEVVTYNAEVGLFGYFRFVFTVLNTGDISWDYALRTVDANPTYSPLLTTFEVLALLFLSVNVLVECAEMMGAFRQLQMWEYVSSPFNWLDWTGFVMQLLAWFSWLQIQSSISRLQLESKGNYFVLADPTSNIRPVSTNATVERQLLELVSKVKGLADLQVDFSVYQGIVVTIFTFKVVKSLDFQPRMGLITRTLSKAGSNLVHYFVLFTFVFLGYSVVGNVMFGSQFGAMSTLSRAFESLMFMFISFDSTQFYAQMQQAVKRDGAAGIEHSLYIWSFVFVSNLILLNILLAILVEAYKAVAADSEGASSILEGLSEALIYTFQFLTRPAKCFVSDDQLLRAARAELLFVNGRRSSAHGRIAQANAAFMPQQALLVGNGLSVNHRLLADLTARVLECSKGGMLNILTARSTEAAVAATCTRYSMIAEDIIYRHGTERAVKNNQASTEVQRLLVLDDQNRLIRLESRITLLEKSILNIQDLLVRLLDTDPGMKEAKGSAAFSNFVAMNDEARGSDSFLTTGTLSVTVLRARKLPRADVMFECNTYCTLFFNCSSGRAGVDNDTELIHTRAVAGNHPEWKENFNLRIPSSSFSLVISLWDQDGRSAATHNDDLIGSTEVELHSIFNREIDSRNPAGIMNWYPLHNPMLGSRLHGSEVQLQVRCLPV